ncbi:mechanosensitive ion channel family protein [Polaribacter sp. SA4-12]|uniref:mechanosensitive ion channel family protein n=1 Tax=Polaribacter sp. SA4-12 TaxID=1312072 RepID=UPI000B3C7D9E|nr:mechanosensitive ion channel domain-containing protein [Polaribacter sp. SA4-12]ARV15048.1 mechanosensitive ion channel protein MscS [Polaribacter sp. SA4-12]
MQGKLEQVTDTIVEEANSILDYTFTFSKEISISLKGLLFVAVALVVTAFVLKLLRRFITRKMPENDKVKFISVFSYIRWVVFLVIFLIAMDASGVNVTAVFAASAVLLIGVGLALQTLFQDIISGIFILVDQSVHVGDIIELEGKVGRVLDIRLRTTRAVTIDNKVLVIPNHLYLTNILFNWTENGTETRESVTVGVAYGSDVELVKQVLLAATKKNDKILKIPEPKVLFTDFADSSLNFKLVFSLNDSFETRFVQSDLRFEIDKKFKENNITIPFPQRDVHLIK